MNVRKGLRTFLRAQTCEIAGRFGGFIVLIRNGSEGTGGIDGAGLGLSEGWHITGQVLGISAVVITNRSIETN
jgi:hypothetical protein